MKTGYPTRIYNTEKDKALMWDRWQKGESLQAYSETEMPKFAATDENEANS